MYRSGRPLRRRKLRRLQVSKAGAWYVALTVAMGVVALVSGNNVLYLIESLLLSGLVFSGVLSERTIDAVRVEFQRRPAEARRPARDQIVLRNRRRFPLFCVEICEWHEGRLEPLAFVPRIGPRETVTVPSAQRFEHRGAHRWDGFAITTRYPFGFARKAKLVWSPGERLIWPERLERGGPRGAGNTAEARRAGAAEPQDGEVRPYTLEDDLRLIVWTLSARGTTPLVRARRAPDRSPELTLDLRTEPGPDFERLLSRAATELQLSDGPDGALTLLDWERRRVVRGRLRALNELALAEPAGARRRTRDRRPA